MKHARVFVVIATLAAGAAPAAPFSVRGSDTLKDFLAAIITGKGLDADLTYVGGGSGTAQAAISACDTTGQTIGPMSKAYTGTPSPACAPVVDNVIAYDGVDIFVNDGAASGLATHSTSQISYDTLKKIFTCQVTDWSDVPGSGVAPGNRINVYTRDNPSGTSDNVRSKLGLPSTWPDDAAAFPCLNVCRPTGAADDCTDRNGNAVAADGFAIAYLGGSGLRPGVRALPVSATGVDGTYVAPGGSTICDNSYPLARQLHVYETGGAVVPDGAQKLLLDTLKATSGSDRTLVCTNLVAQDFFACNADGTVDATCTP